MPSAIGKAGPADESILDIVRRGFQALRTERMLIERANHGSLTDLCLYVLTDVTGVRSGRSVIMAKGGWDGPLIAGWETVL